MAKTLVGTFDTAADAERVAAALADSGIQRREIQVIDNAAARGHQERWRQESQSGSFWSWLFGDVESDRGTGLSEDDDAYYSGAFQDGAALLVVTTRDENAARVRELMERRGAQHVEARAADEQPSAEATAPSRGGRDKDEVVPVVEERLNVGKRAVERGIRVYTHTSERPVEEHIKLRDERIRVERRSVDRPLTATTGAFKDQTLEFTETTEVPVVEKQARVVEEVVVSKDVQEREHAVKDTVRRTDVEVERTGDPDRSGFATMEPEFRQHCTRTFGKAGVNYEQCSPAYRYGYELGLDKRRSGDWTAVESSARREWEEQRPGTWERFKEAIRYAWDSARGKARAA